ncbi:MAG TPA: hypothetical protein VGV90_11550 [Solirubrobacteraceae bacterium]|nr:hypothetical protein [Solirubrobacteraceae bacterium]
MQRKIGPAWTERGRPPEGYVTKRLAEAWLRDVLDQARRGSLPGMVRTGATFADAAAEFLRYVADERACKPSTLRDYRSIIDASLAALRQRADRGRDAGDDRRMASLARCAPLVSNQEQAARRSARHFPPRKDRVEAADQPGCGNREVPAALERRHRGVLA